MSTWEPSEGNFSPWHFFFLDKFFVLNYDVIKIHNKVTQCAQSELM